ncbi:MAG: prolyl oligopeptidase family serine peptidase [Deltaproteobacteria bacterium]|jgi:dienelactone hydrolase
MHRYPFGLLVLLAFACSDPDPAPPDMGDRDGGVARDGGALPRDGGAQQEPKPLAPDAPLEPYAVAMWTYATIPEGDPDPIVAALTAGTFETPRSGTDENGIRWRAARIEGFTIEVPGAGAGTRYFCAQLLAEERAGLVGRFDGSANVYMNGAPLLGDFYRRGRLRVALPLEAGFNDLCVRYASDAQRGPPELELWRTTDEVAFNTANLTVPHLLTGDTTTQWVGLPVLNLTNAPAIELKSRVVESAWFAATEETRVGLAGGSAPQVAFRLEPKQAVTEPDTTIEVELEVESASLDFRYRTTIELETITATATHRRTRVSRIDHSVQYYAVVPPSNFDPNREYGVILALHGAAVEALGHARAYSRKDWAYVVAPTNRHPFGFDWEDWGRLDAIEALDEAIAQYRIDETRVYLTGHSMGGHGTWNVGVNHPDRFAVLGPSAGWSQFDQYGGARSPQGPGLAEAFRAAQHQSQTLDILENIEGRGIYIIHGDADNNVPVTLGRQMRDAARTITEDVQYHEQPGAGHWWNGDVADGADCVDWTPMMDFMQARTVDTNPTSFTFHAAAPWVNGRYGFVNVLAVEDPYATSAVTSTSAGAGMLALTTDNVALLELDGGRLMEAGISSVTVDGEVWSVTNDLMRFGAAVKTPGAHGPFKEAFLRPFLFVYPDDGDYYRRYAAYLITAWQLIGNGYATALPVSALTEALRAEHHIVYLGVGADALADTTNLPVQWDATGVTVGPTRYDDAAIITVFPEDGRLSALIHAPAGDETLLNGVIPFRSGFGYPDYFVFERRGARTAGFFDEDWQHDAALAR